MWEERNIIPLKFCLFSSGKSFSKISKKGPKETRPFITASLKRSHWGTGSCSRGEEKIWVLNWARKTFNRQCILSYHQIFKSLPFSSLDFQHLPELWTWWHAVQFPGEQCGFYNIFERSRVTNQLYFWFTIMKYVDSMGPWKKHRSWVHHHQ